MCTASAPRRRAACLRAQLRLRHHADVARAHLALDAARAHTPLTLAWRSTPHALALMLPRAHAPTSAGGGRPRHEVARGREEGVVAVSKREEEGVVAVRREGGGEKRCNTLNI